MDIFDNNFKIYFPDKNIFVSRDHHWAFAAWEIARLRNLIKSEASLLHIDSHLDFVDPNYDILDVEIKEESEALNVASNLKIFDFIKAARFVGLVDKCYMVSDDNVGITSEEALYTERAYTWNHYMKEKRMSWFAEDDEKDLIVDIDLDFFNLNNIKGNEDPILLHDQKIELQLNEMKNMQDWKLTTVSLSPEYCGGKEPCEHLFNLLLKEYDLSLGDAKEIK
ncbi:UPF0489 family protein [Oceanobacillus sp. 1P07AA]|uniref:UPF0489 family protein n=1 Tax=Oceanobacillus sp. 1P07AA TaxID=3132293 RepID=UPI0039A435BF